MKRIIAGTLLALSLAGCSAGGGSATSDTKARKDSSAPATNAPPTAAPATQGCLPVPASFFQNIEAHGKVIKSAAIKAGVTSQPMNRGIWEIAAKFDDGGVAVWQVVADSEGNYGLTFPMNATARKHSDQGVDAPSSVITRDPGGVSSAESCVS